MMQQSAGSQASQQEPSPGKKQLDKYVAPDGPLSQFIDQAMQKLQENRNPSSFQQAANGAVPQTLAYNKDYYV